MVCCCVKWVKKQTRCCHSDLFHSLANPICVVDSKFLFPHFACPRPRLAPYGRWRRRRGARLRHRHHHHRFWPIRLHQQFATSRRQHTPQIEPSRLTRWWCWITSLSCVCALYSVIFSVSCTMLFSFSFVNFISIISKFNLILTAVARRRREANEQLDLIRVGEVSDNLAWKVIFICLISER